MSRAYAYRESRWWSALRVEDGLVLGAVGALPWAFGGVEVWAFRTAAAALTAAAVVHLWRRQPGADRRWVLPAWLLVALAVLQIVPLPAGAVRVLSPRAAALQDSALPSSWSDRSYAGWIAYVEDQALRRVPEGTSADVAAGPATLVPDVEAADPPGRWRTLSLHRAATVEMLFWFLALLAGFWVTERRVASPEVAKAYRLALFGLFTALAVVGLFDAVAGNGKILWIREPLTGGRHFGPYINSTHFAGAMELGAPWLLGFGWLALRREGLASFRRGGSAPLALACGGLCVAAALAAASKMAALMLGLSLVVLAWLALETRRARTMLALSIAVLAVPAALAMRASALGERIRDFVAASGGDIGGYERVVAWRAGLTMLADYPLFGCGFGAFPQVFPAYIPAGESGYWLRVHNDWLEVALEGGCLAFGLVVWLAVAWARRARAAARAAQGSSSRLDLARVGLWLGLASLTVHAFVDFNHQIPANALLFVTLAAVALAPGAGPAKEEGR